MQVNLNKLREYEEQGLIRSQKHPIYDRIIWNYTQKCQGERKFDDYTVMCRGLITDPLGVVYARPFDKFFNWEEHESPELKDIPQNETFVAYDKMDGSLGITYLTPKGYKLATRGSFMSDQALKGSEMLHHTELFKPDMTYLFEIIYPENRIVLDYSGEEKLVFLGARSIETGEVFTPDWFPDITSVYESPMVITDYSNSRDNAEGVVIYFKSGFMVKVKYEEYVRLHRLVTGVTKRRIWDLLRNGESVDELLERVPEEFEKWVRSTIDDLMGQFYEMKKNAENVLVKVVPMDNRKDQAMYINTYPQELRGIVFAMLDRKPIEPIIWRLLKPKHEVPFKEEV